MLGVSRFDEAGLAEQQETSRGRSQKQGNEALVHGWAEGGQAGVRGEWELSHPSQ